MTILNIQDTLSTKSTVALKDLILDEQAIFSSGIGINPTPEIPIRYLAYILPMISCVQQYSNAMGQIYTADQGAIRLGIEKTIVEKNVTLLREFTNAFISTMFPEIESKIIISEEKKSCGPDIQAIREQFITRCIEILQIQNDPQIINFARNRANANESSPLRYMVEHSLYARDTLFNTTSYMNDIYLVENPKGFENSRIVMIGGPAEKIFYKTRQAIIKVLGALCEQKNIQLFTDIGRLPPYYRKYEETIVGNQIKEDYVADFIEGINRELQYDYLILIIACAQAPDFTIIKRRKSGFTKNDLEVLQNGFERLKIFLNNF